MDAGAQAGNQLIRAGANRLTGGAEREFCPLPFVRLNLIFPGIIEAVGPESPLSMGGSGR